MSVRLCQKRLLCCYRMGQRYAVLLHFIVKRNHTWSRFYCNSLRSEKNLHAKFVLLYTPSLLLLLPTIETRFISHYDELSRIFLS